jgi:hypothetical protein
MNIPLIPALWVWSDPHRESTLTTYHPSAEGDIPSNTRFKISAGLPAERFEAVCGPIEPVRYPAPGYPRVVLEKLPDGFIA